MEIPLLRLPLKRLETELFPMNQKPVYSESNQWHRYGDPMTLVDPNTLKKAMQTMTERYGVKFRFCNRRQTPIRVIKYLKGEMR